MSAAELRAYVARLVGYADPAAVDRALESLALGLERRAALTILGDPREDLTAIAAGIHRRALGDRPFVVADPHGSTLAAVADAAGGTVVLALRHPPPDISLAADALREPAGPALVVLVADAGAAGRYLIPGPCAPLAVPPLSERRDEIDRVINEYVSDAATELAAAVVLLARDVEWLRSIASHGDLEVDARRIVALRRWGVTHGAQRLGITHGALSRWAHRRGLSTL